MQSVLKLPSPLLLIFVFLFVAFCFAVSLLLARWFQRRPNYAEQIIPVPAFLGVIATAWALSLGFAASDVWTLGNRADQAIAAERSAIQRLLGVATPAALDVPQLQEDIRRYVGLVESNEGIRRSDGPMDTPDVDAAIENIRVTIIQIAGSDIPAAIATKIISDFDELQDARSARLGVNMGLTDSSKWYLLLALTFLTMVTIALVHANRPPAGQSALIIFSVAAFAGLWILVIHTEPLFDTRQDYLSYNLGPLLLDNQ